MSASSFSSFPPARKIIVAIDGPAGAGKSTIARHVARHFGLLNLETGAMYRAFALKALRADIPFQDRQRLEALAAETVIRLEPGEEDNRVLLDGEDVTGLIRNQTVTDAASQVSVWPAIRAWLVRLQQRMGAEGGVVMEGRDIGTVVFPKAELKIFLDASPEVRAERRWKEHQEKGDHLTVFQVLEEVRQRDQRDRERKVSPLVRAADAVIVDNTAMDVEETARLIVMLARERDKDFVAARRNA